MLTNRDNPSATHAVTTAIEDKQHPHAEIDSLSNRPTMCVLFDIDETLIRSDESIRKNILLWNGGSEHIWLKEINALKAAAAKARINLHFGIATFKKHHDDFSIDVIERAFAGILNPDLIFFTRGKSKVKYALDFAHTIMSLSCVIEKNDLSIIDDQPLVIKDARSAGYSAICASTLLNADNYSQQLQISHYFNSLHKYIAGRAQLYLDREKRVLINLLRMGHHELAKKLVAKFPDLAETTTCSKDGSTPLQLALLANNPDVVLVTILAENDERFNYANQDNETVLSIALVGGHFHLIDYFLEKHAHKCALVELKWLLASLIQIHQYPLAKNLLEQHPDAAGIYFIDRDENSALHLALLTEEPDFELVKLLSQNSYVLLQHENKQGWSVLTTALLQKHYHILEYFLSCHAGQFTQDQLGMFLFELQRKSAEDFLGEKNLAFKKLLLEKRPDAIKSRDYHACKSSVFWDRQGKFVSKDKRNIAYMHAANIATFLDPEDAVVFSGGKVLFGR